jgi:hypothetical protein
MFFSSFGVRRELDALPAGERGAGASAGPGRPVGKGSEASPPVEGVREAAGREGDFRRRLKGAEWEGLRGNLYREAVPEPQELFGVWHDNPVGERRRTRPGNGGIPTDGKK